MKRNDFLESVGFGFIANHGTKELHRVKRIKPRCKIELVRSGGYCTGFRAFLLRKLCGYDGCAVCNKKHHSK
jgi:hypothetical protein